MCKTLLSTGVTSATYANCGEADPDDCPDLYQLCWNIINIQSTQIYTMEDYLSLQHVNPDALSNQCFPPIPGSSADSGFTNQEPFLIAIVVLVAVGVVLAATLFGMGLAGAKAAA